MGGAFWRPDGSLKGDWQRLVCDALATGRTTVDALYEHYQQHDALSVAVGWLFEVAPPPPTWLAKAADNTSVFRKLLRAIPGLVRDVAPAQRQDLLHVVCSRTHPCTASDDAIAAIVAAGAVMGDTALLAACTITMLLNLHKLGAKVDGVNNDGAPLAAFVMLWAHTQGLARDQTLRLYLCRRLCGLGADRSLPLAAAALRTLHPM